MSQTALIQRKLITSDLSEIVRVHKAAFPESAMTQLGDEVLRRYYASQLALSDETLRVGRFDGDRLVGFIIAGVANPSIAIFLANNRKFLALQVVKRPWLLFNPLVRDRVARGLQILKRPAAQAAMKSQPVPQGRRKFNVLAIGVDPARQGTGSGQALMAAAEELARQLEFETMGLTVHPDNTRAVHFYEKQGWERIEEADGWKGQMRKAVPSAVVSEA